MFPKIQFGQFLDCISRSVPCLMYFEEKNKLLNEIAISNIENKREIYKYVLCYKSDWDNVKTCSTYDRKNSSSDIYCFKNFKIFYCCSALSETCLDNIFRTIHNDCVINYGANYNKILIKEKRIRPRFKHSEYKIVNLSYDIYFGQTKKNRQTKELLSKHKIDSETCKNDKKLSLKFKKSPNNINDKLNSDLKGIVPVSKGLPSFKIFSIPLTEIPTSQYFIKNIERKYTGEEEIIQETMNDRKIVFSKVHKISKISSPYK